MAISDYELESLGGSEYELEGEFEGEYESEYELEGEFEYELEGEFEDEFEDEYEYEMEGEFEFEATPPGVRVAAGSAMNTIAPAVPTASPVAVMEHLGHAATVARSEAEAEAFLGALVPLAANIIPRVAPSIMRAAPKLISGVAKAARVLRKNPATRPMVRALPTVMRDTARVMAQRASQGRPVTPETALRIFAGQTSRALGNRRRCRKIIRRNIHLVQQAPHAGKRTTF